MKLVCDTCGHIARSENTLDHNCDTVRAKTQRAAARAFTADRKRRERLVGLIITAAQQQLAATMREQLDPLSNAELVDRAREYGVEVRQ